MKTALWARAFLPVVCLLVIVALVACGGVSKSSSNNGGGSGTPGNPSGSGGTPSPLPSPSPSPSPTPSPSPSPTPSPSGPATDAELTTDVLATNLQEPWSLAFAPDGRLFFTEATGRLRVIQNGSLVAQPVFDLSSQTSGFEGGLTGMDLDRNFASNGLVYAHFCTKAMHCEVIRIKVQGNTGTLDKVLLDYPITNFDHVGGRLKIGPDDLLYLSVGDHDNPNSAQNGGSWDGKILRMNLDGTAAGAPGFASNPYVYALGTRDPQGLAFDSSGTLYETDNGPTNNDEVNIITAGGNYGWPNCVGSCNNSSFTDPVVNLAPSAPSMPPSGATFYNGATIPGWNGSLLIAVLGLDNNPQAHQIRQIIFDTPGGKTVTFQQGLFVNQFGRIRDVIEGPDGFIYFATSNFKQGTHGAPDDDRIIRVRPK